MVLCHYSQRSLCVSERHNKEYIVAEPAEREGDIFHPGGKVQLITAGLDRTVPDKNSELLFAANHASWCGVIPVFRVPFLPFSLLSSQCLPLWVVGFSGCSAGLEVGRGNRRFQGTEVLVWMWRVLHH